MNADGVYIHEDELIRIHDGEVRVFVGSDAIERATAGITDWRKSDDKPMQLVATNPEKVAEWVVANSVRCEDRPKAVQLMPDPITQSDRKALLALVKALRTATDPEAVEELIDGLEEILEGR